MRLYAALAHAFSVMAPVAMTICLVSGKIWKSRGRYWKMMLKRRMSFLFAVADSFSIGTRIQITNCKFTHTTQKMSLTQYFKFLY